MRTYNSSREKSILGVETIVTVGRRLERFLNNNAGRAAGHIRAQQMPPSTGSTDWLWFWCTVVSGWEPDVKERVVELFGSSARAKAAAGQVRWRVDAQRAGTEAATAALTSELSALREVGVEYVFLRMADCSLARRRRQRPAAAAAEPMESEETGETEEDEEGDDDEDEDGEPAAEAGVEESSREYLHHSRGNVTVRRFGEA